MVFDVIEGGVLLPVELFDDEGIAAYGGVSGHFIEYLALII